MCKKTVYVELEFSDVNPKFPAPIITWILARHDGTYIRLSPELTESEVLPSIEHLIEELRKIEKEWKREFPKL